MKIEIEVDAGEVCKTIEETIKNLSERRREAIAVEVIEKWFASPQDDERRAHEERCREPYGSGHRRDCRWESSKDRLWASVAREVSEETRKRIREMIDRDSKLQSLYRGASEKVAADFPLLVRDAVALWIASRFEEVKGCLLALMQSKSSTEEVLERLKQLPR